MDDLFLTKTLEATARMLDQVRGAFSEAMTQIENQVLEQRFVAAIEGIDVLLGRYQLGKHLVQPWQVAIVGPPNVGKSSLLNALLGYERAIVHETAGTTRDLLHEPTAFLGWPIQLVDTAGLRETDDAIEYEGVARASQIIREADLLLGLVDPFEGWTETHEALMNDYGSKLLIVHTKSDLSHPRPSLPSGVHAAVGISSRFGVGIEGLSSEIIKLLIPNVPPLGSAIPFRECHVQSLKLIKAAALQATAEQTMPLSD
jgi:tRNA modification GTPase